MSSVSLSWTLIVYLSMAIVSKCVSSTYPTPDCHTVKPWHCDTSPYDVTESSQDVLRFENRQDARYPDIKGKVYSIKMKDLDRAVHPCDTCSSIQHKTELSITELRKEDSDKWDCFAFTLKETCHSSSQLCIDISGALWYGGSELHGQRWPLNQATVLNQPYISNDFVTYTTSYGNVLERIWISSKGAVIFINESVPLYLSVDQNQLCFTAKYGKHFKNAQNSWPILNMTVCDTDNVKEAFNVVNEMFVDRVGGIPDERMFKSPIWSTWAKYKTEINETTVRSYADEIVDNGFSNSQLEIDDMYSSYYGDLDFDSEKFKNASGMVAALKSRGFRVTVWVTPFANPNAKAFEFGAKNSYWLPNSDGAPALVKWWQGIGAVLDVTNEDAVDWFVTRLNRMKEVYGIDSFKFDAGETNYVPTQCDPKVPWEDSTQYATKYVEAVSQMGSMIEVRCGYRSQKYPVFVRMADKESRWGYDNGLKTLIPTVLTLGILGYPYILPDMIGGNGYNYDDDVDNPFVATKIPDRELYIRWLEVTSYFPAMQFSFVPWQYDSEVVEIAGRYVKLHEEIVTPLVLKAAEEAQAFGTPIIRPLWWHDPDDINALETDSQFLVGSTLLVAPILDRGARKRDIYIPKGVWEDELRGNTIEGGQWLRNYIVNLDEIATFRFLE